MFSVGQIIVLLSVWCSVESWQWAPNHGRHVASQIQLDHCPNKKGRNLLIDLGANCGNSFKKLAEQYGNFDRYYLWEMNPLLFPQLKKIAQEEQNITFVPYGAWYEHKTMEMDILGEDQDACDPAKSFWDGTTIVETGWVQHDDTRYHSTVTAQTRDFSAWYKQTICLEDQVSLKMDIEKAEFAVIAKMLVDGILCHPQRMLIEFHVPGEPLKVNQHITQWAISEEQKKECFTAGYISTFEYIIQFCKREPELVRWD
eukprot:TRINITY_DN29_c0_g5_i1.p1 TRINITY_DN29_c0_g5~~TRINITY_DN29_c0_g5_i1.p1  ORF type:complete len:257 (-),score=30.56 TRINITY_DN29_c0_g5_i1:370-1140(-)